MEPTTTPATTPTEVRGYQPVPYAKEADDTVTCPGCGRMDSADANYCDQCDHPLTATASYERSAGENVQCPDCDLYNDNDAEFCDQCGIRLEGRPDVTVSGDTAGDAPNSEDDAAMDGADPEGEMETPDNVSGFEDGGASESFTSRVQAGEVRRENLIRARRGGIELRADGDAASPVTQLVGIFSEYNVWYEVNSYWEGTFMEQILPGAFTQTIKQDMDAMRCLFDHGFDYTLANKPLGPIRSIKDTPAGPSYVVDLLNTDYNRDFIIPALRGELMSGELAGSQLGASMRFEVMEDEWNYSPKVSKTNPQALPERSITRARVFEFGPVTFPANPGATAAARSMSDRWIENLQTNQRFFRDFEERVGKRVAERVRGSVPDGLGEKIRAADREKRVASLKLRARAVLALSRV